MTIPLTREQLLALRARNSGLAGEGFRGVELAVSGLAAVHALSPVPALALLPRVRAFRYAELEDAADEHRALVRLTGLRGQTHLVHRALAPALLDATQGPRREATFALAERLRIPVPVLDVIRNHVVEALLGQPPMTGAELARLLERRVPQPETLNQVLGLFCAEGTLVRATNKGEWQGNVFTYALLAEWLPEAAEPGDEAEATRRLADAYVRAHGPATVQDFCAWSGIPLQDAAPAFADLSGEWFEVDGAPHLGYAVHLRRLDEPPEPSVALLPHNDPLLQGYLPENGPVPPEAHPLVIDPAGNTASVVVMDGEAVALWDARWSKRRMGVRVAPLPNAPPDLARRLEPALNLLAQLVRVPEVNVEAASLPPPLAERPPWAHMLPLRGLEPPESA